MKYLKTYEFLNPPLFQVGEYIRLYFSPKQLDQLSKMSLKAKPNYEKNKDKLIYQVIDVDPNNKDEPYTVKNVFTNEIEKTDALCFIPIEEYEVDAIKYNL